jgi:hypothetical protein
VTRIQRFYAGLVVAAVVLTGAACSSDDPSSVRSVADTATSVQESEDSATDSTVTTVSPAELTSPQPSEAGPVIVTTTTEKKSVARVSGPVSAASEPEVTTTTAAPQVTTTTVSQPASTTTTTARVLTATQPLSIVRDGCTKQLAAGLPYGMDMPRLRAGLEAEGFAAPAVTFKDPDGMPLTDSAVRAPAFLQSRLDDCASQKGGPVTVELLRTGDAGGDLLGRLVVAQLGEVGYKNYKGTTVSTPPIP